MKSAVLVSLIVAADLDGVIGREGKLPWHLPADLQRFKRLTLGHHLVVGRKTYESIGRPLPGRTMLVVTRREGYGEGGITVVPTPERALAVAEAAGESETFVAGGAQIYRALLPRAGRIYLTRLEGHVGGDTTFPDPDPSQFRLESSETRPADGRNPWPLRFEVWDRVG